MRVLITGASGLVGQHIVERLSKEKDLSLILLSKNHQSQKGNWVQLDLSQENLDSSLIKLEPDLIIHCAAIIPSKTISVEDAAKANEKIDQLIYKLAVHSKADMIFISSVAIYENETGCWSEEESVSPTSSYAVQKLRSEQLFSKLDKSSVALRISSPYGGKQSASRNVLYTFVHAAIRGKQLTVMGTGKRRQDFVFGTDIAEAVCHITSSIVSGRTLTGVFNIAHGLSISMEELANIIIEVAGGGTVVYSEAEKRDEVVELNINIDKAKEILGWQPKVTISQGLAKIIENLGCSI